MCDRRGRVGVAFLGWLLASCATAALAHAAIGLVGVAGFGGDAYGEHTHAAVVPVALAALSLGVALLFRSALGALRRSEANDPVAELGRRCGEVQPLLACIAVALGASATLVAMEFVEQLASLGHIDGIADALGGSTFVGLAIIAVCASIVAIVALRSAHVLLSGAVAAARAVFSWIVVAPRPRADEAIVRRTPRDTQTCSPAFIARCFGMRAPPLPARV